MFGIATHCIAILTCFFAASHLEAKPPDQTPQAVKKTGHLPGKGGVRVLLEDHPKAISLKVSGGYGIYDPVVGKRVTGGVLDKSFELRAGPDGLSWGEAFPDLYQFTLVPEGQPGFYLQNRHFPGILHVYQIGDQLQLVNEISFEEFALALLSEQSWKNPPLEAVAGLAICARTQAATFSKVRSRQFWHVEALRCGYRGLSASPLGADLLAQTKSLDLVLKGHHGDNLIPEWTPHCAGHTVDYDRMHWGDTTFSKGHTRGVASDWARKTRDATSWSFAIDRAEFARAFHLRSPFEIHLERDLGSQKVLRVVIGDAGGKKALNYFRFQRQLPQIKSSEFTIEHERDKLVISGWGEGPGIGLCLYSCAAMAREGKSAREILEHFFPNAHLHLLKSPSVLN